MISALPALMLSMVTRNGIKSVSSRAVNVIPPTVVVAADCATLPRLLPFWSQ